MAHVSMYVHSDDVRLVRAKLESVTEVAILSRVGKSHRFVASRDFTCLEGTTMLWHVPSGPPRLPDDSEILDPWDGWEEKVHGEDHQVPFFGAGEPRVFALTIRTAGLRNSSALGLSGLGWIGAHYACVGRPPPDGARRWFESFRRWVSKSATKIPRGGPADGPFPEVWAFPAALRWAKEGRPLEERA